MFSTCMTCSHILGVHNLVKYLEISQELNRLHKLMAGSNCLVAFSNLS